MKTDRYYIEEDELGAGGRVTLHTEPNPSRIPGVFIPTDSESIKEMREKIKLAIDGRVDDWHPSSDGEIERAVLAAIGITEEQQP